MDRLSAQLEGIILMLADYRSHSCAVDQKPIKPHCSFFLPIKKQVWL